MASRAELARQRLKARMSRKEDGKEEEAISLDQAVEEESVERTIETESGVTASMEVEDELKQSEKLVNNLKKRRRRTQKELSKTLEGKETEDIRAEMRDAKQKTKQHLLEETSKSATEAEETEAEDKGKHEVPRISIPKESEETTRPESARRRTLSTDSKKESPPSTDRTDVKKLHSSREESVATRRVSANLADSIRAKLSQKLREAKDKGKDEAYDETRQTERKLKDKRGLARSTRFDDPGSIREEDLEVERELRKSLEAKVKWKDTIDKVTGKKVVGESSDDEPDLPSADEQFDFFVRQWESDEEEDKDKEDKLQVKKQKAESKEGEEPKEDEGQEEEEQEEEDDKKKKKKKKKKKDSKSEEEVPLLPDIDLSDDFRQYYCIGKAEYKPFHEKMKTEAEIYFCPSMRAPPLEKKIYNQDQPRFLEEEGFFVGQRPQVPAVNLNRMENRLLNEGERSRPWFGEDGKLITLPDPLKEVPSRPAIIDDIEPALETEYRKAVVSDSDGRIINGLYEEGGHYQLDVDVNTIIFSHHHLFSKEHVLSARLSDMYQQYIARNKQRVADILTEKLKALKSAASHVQDTINKLKAERRPSKQALEDQQKRLKDYKDEIRLTRQQRDSEMLADRLLIKHIIQTWKDIKSLRTTQKYISTPTKLIIRKEPVKDPKVEELELEQELQEQLEELKEEAEEEYNKAMDDYKKKLEAWKKQKQEKKEASKRQKRRRRHHSQEETEEIEDNDQKERDEKILEAEELEKPEKPKMMSDAEARQKIIDRLNEVRRKPGEPKISFELGPSCPITPTSQCPREEQQRRNDVNRHKISVKVMFNDKEVSQTPSKPLGQDFIVRFAQIFNIEIMQWPESIKMEIYESVGMTTTLMAVVCAPIPEPNVTTENVSMEEIEFSSDVIKGHSHAAVGSGICPIDEGTDMQIIPMTSGIFTTNVAWAVDDEGNVLVPPQALQSVHQSKATKCIDPISAIGMSGMANKEKLLKWISESHLDPNDPSNAGLLYSLKPSGGCLLTPALMREDYFRLEQLQEEFNFATDEEINTSRRFRMIELREKEVPEFQNKTIPLFDEEVPDDTFTEYERKKREEERLKSSEVTESHRVAVARFMQKVREQVIERFRQVQHQKVLAEMVCEDAVPNIGTIIPTLMKLAEPRRPLKPIRKERKKVTAQNLQGVDVRLLVNIVRAFGIPVRVPETTEVPRPHDGTGKSSKLKNLFGETQVRPYIEVTFQRNVQATAVADGPNPTWNEELSLPFRPPNNDYSSANLQTIKDVLFINIFDEFVTNIKHDGQDSTINIHQRLEKRWLGTLKIPFSTIYFNSKIEGTFRVEKPPVLLGYEHDSNKRSRESDTEVNTSQSTDTYISLFVTIQPPLTPAEPVLDKFESNEDEKLLRAAESWQSELEKRFPKREYKATVIDLNGKSVFITRYLRALKPPEELIEGDNLTEKCERVARYVSMIPSVSDSVIFPGLCDIWSTCDQFLQMLQGDEEEHAVLLANYFKYLKKDCYLLLGSAIPEGPTAYVLTRESNQWWLWNASTGDHFNTKDSYCPVQSVGCLVTEENIWGNIQPHDQPNRIHFNLSNTKQWKPFFHRGFSNPGITSIQPSELIYHETDKTFVLDLTDKIERCLKEKIMEWRSLYITRWNRYCMHSFRRLLSKLEESRGSYNLQQEHSHEMEQILGSYKICGFPINMPYTEIGPIVDAVHATGVHKYDSNEVEFALVTYIHPYPNSVLSVWVYVANLVRKR